MTADQIRAMRAKIGDSQVTQCEFLREIAAQLAELNRNIGELTILLADRLRVFHVSSPADPPPLGRTYK